LKKIIAFVCIHNSCRSQMAEGWANHFAKDILEVYSAGTEEYPSPKPLAIEVMEDADVDMSSHYSKTISCIPSNLDILITMGCGVECPYIPTTHREDWALDDPSGGPKEDFERTRDIIKEKVLELISRIKRNEL